MTKYDYDIGVIGGGAAGLTVTAGSAQLGAKTLLIEKEPALGGDCLHYGCVPSKTLIRTAQVYHQLKKLETFGLPAVRIPSVDFKPIAERIQQVIQKIQAHDSVERFCKLGARVAFGQAEFIDDHSVRMDGESLSARTWVLATGSSPSAPRIPGLDTTTYLTNKDIFSLEALPGSMIVLGAGPIACEMAQAFARLGTEVQVVQRSGQILSKEDHDLADLLQARLEAEGVRFHLKAGVKGVRDLGQTKEVLLTDADGLDQTLRAEQLLVALGREANVSGLSLENAGIDFTPKGIAVDSRMRTTQKHIYAAGDVTGMNQFTHAAGFEGGIVVSNAVFHVPRKADDTLMPWCTYTEPELASIGLNEKRAAAKGVETRIFIEPFSQNDRSLAQNEDLGRIKLLLDIKEKPLGVQILGPHAGELLSEWVAALNSGAKLTTLAGAIHPYPTLAEINKRVVGKVLEPKIFSEAMQKALKFFFNFKGRACGV
ncbi:MAG: FAD-dependent oxidoreductase [Desulfobacteraceae bacterium]|jgi:pyruvate/2-oxoglutarate dehydrogenase complex dihydrolipoamide dehydrogenase (E3) component